MSASTRAALLLLLSTSLAPAQVRFLTPSRLPMPVNPGAANRFAVGDVNGDGFPDLVIANSGGTGEQNRLFLNDGFGGFVDVTATHLPPGLDVTMAVTLGDVDGDGDLDLFFANSTYLNAIRSRLCLNDGTGHFTDVGNTQLPPLNQAIYCARFVDFDGDGDLDLVARQNLLRNDGTGHFTDISVMNPPSAYYSSGVAAGDFDGDGDVDLVYVNTYDSTIVPPVLWLNNGNGTFIDASANLPVRQIYSFGDPAVGDVDGDGDLDLFVPCYGRQSQLWLNDGHGVFTDATASNLPVLVDPTYAALLVDLDGDGDLDLVLVSSALGGQSRVLINDGHGVFSLDPAAAPTLGLSSLCAAAADLDGDGDADVVVGNRNGPCGVWWNLRRQVHAGQPPLLGGSYPVDYFATPGTPALVLPLLSAAALQPPLPLPPYGSLALRAAVSLQIGTTAPATGRYTLNLAVPNVPGLRGLTLFHQGLVAEGAGLRLTNTFPDRVQ